MKIRTKILICYVSAFSVIILLIGYFMFVTITNYIIMSTVNNMVDNLNKEINIIVDNNKNIDPKILIEKYADTIASSLCMNNYFVKLYNGKSLISHLHYEVDDENSKIDEIVKIALKGKEAYKVKKNLLYVSLPIKFGNEIIGAVEYIHPLTNELNSINFIKLIFEIFGFISIFIILLISIYISYIITKPIKHLDCAARKFLKGNYEILPVKTKDEIGNFTRTFNQMTKTISQQMDDILFEKNKLESVLSALNEGVIAFDDKEDIVFKNQKVDELISDVTYDYILDIVNKTYKNKHIIEEIPTNDKILNIESFLCDGYCTVVIRDVTLDKELIEKQKKFVSNISHELKSPLTAILGFIQILKEEKEYNQVILNYIESETIKLKELVLDILEVSKLQSYELKLQKKTINLSWLLLKICENINLKALKFNISINTNIQDGISLIADEDKISQAIVNLLDNAIKYSNPHNQIDVSLYKNFNREISIKVKDNGIGIPENEIRHIFDRFYRAKNALSIGGNGLGLTIVKEIIEKHGGRIEVASKIDKGQLLR
ncbi:integral membrane sensor signal transduction histidine kinase [Thermoanaerobacterium xylanolyticum LX-11]|uniref:histidine kinase n=2 Tax=Thermoanaerobacterium xylanolyticum TaxID=29329 RepID=F6BHP2_THEXL|nr:integral membrane sensor signal transduction histidine kinase [Thermoanaerobacterium xylanolyticum LX-11]